MADSETAIACPKGNCGGRLEAAPKIYLQLDRNEDGSIDITVEGVQTDLVQVACDDNEHLGDDEAVQRAVDDWCRRMDAVLPEINLHDYQVPGAS